MYYFITGDVVNLIIIMRPIRFTYLSIFLLVSLSQARRDRSSITYVTAFFDIGRSTITTQRRTTTFYYERIGEFLATTANVIFFGQQKIKEFVWSKRSPHNTLFIDYTTKKIEETWMNKLYQKNQQKMYDQNPSQQARIRSFKTWQVPLYMPIMYNKIEWLNIALEEDPFDSEKMFWIDSGFTHVGHIGPVPFNKTNLYDPFQMWSQNTWTFHYMWWENRVLFHYHRDPLYMNYTISHNYYAVGGWFGGRKDAVWLLRCLVQNANRMLLERDGTLSDEAAYTLANVRYPQALFTGFLQNDSRDLNITLNKGVKHQRLLSHTVEPRYRVSTGQKVLASVRGQDSIEGISPKMPVTQEYQRRLEYLYQRIAFLFVMGAGVLLMNSNRNSKQEQKDYIACPSQPQNLSILQ